MITGDHALTALAIGAQMGIGDGSTALSGEEIDALSDERLRELVRQVEVFARVSPEHKLRLVQALQANGEVVAMTGDGINDAPALKRADVGVAMGHKGTEAAKEASEMVLADDNFASIAHAVEEGRTVYDNIKKSITFILPTNGGEAGIIIAAILLGRMLPITPVQILWVNMVTAVTLALALAFEPPEGAVMKRLPRDPKEPLLTRYLVWRICFVSLILIIGTFGLFSLERLAGAPLQLARTIAVNTLVVFEIFYLFNSRFLLEFSLSRNGFFGNSYALGAVIGVICLQMAFTYFPPLQHLFDTVPLSPEAWVHVILVGLSVLVLVELEKLVARTFFFNKQQSQSVTTRQVGKAV
jgi:magnesium-transporting ATPase (P-type)